MKQESPRMAGEIGIQKKACFMRRPYPSIVAPGSKDFALEAKIMARAKYGKEPLFFTSVHNYSIYIVK